MLPAPAPFPQTARTARRTFGLLAPLYDPFARAVSSAARQAFTSTLAITGNTVWDLGCGTGLTARALPRAARYVGVDASPAMLARAPSVPHARWVCADALGWIAAQPDRSTDAVLSCYCVDAWPADRRALLLAHAWRCLRPGGTLGLITVAPPRSPGERLWTAASAFFPALLGGSRPLDPTSEIVRAGFTLGFSARRSQLGVPSLVLVAHRP